MEWHESEDFKYDKFQAYYDHEHDFGNGNYKNSCEQAFNTAWDYQQQQLIQKDAENEKLRELLVEACEIQSCNCDMSGTVDFGICDGCHFLNKPEIKQLLNKGGD